MLSEKEIRRYSRHILLEEIGKEGQEKLKAARVLVAGAGGLGCPALLYLAAAGVGTIGIIDFDKVDESNLQRQVLYTAEDVGKSKALSAKTRLEALNPHIQIAAYNEKLDNSNALALFRQYDIIVDGSDNFSTRYLINDACLIACKPWVYGSIHRFEGQTSVFNYRDANGTLYPTYRCLFPVPPAPGSAPSCSEAGVLGVLPGIIGSLQASEVIKMITGAGELLAGKMFILNALTMKVSMPFFSRNDAWEKNVPVNEEEMLNFNYDIFCDPPHVKNNLKEITPSELEKMLSGRENLFFLDVRERMEEPAAKDFHALNIPLGEIEKHKDWISTEKKVIVFCKSGGRSRNAIRFLEEKYGFSNLYNLKGGILSWMDHNSRNPGET